MRKSFYFHVDALRESAIDEFELNLAAFLSRWEASGLVLISIPENPTRETRGEITPREREIWELVAAGKSNKTIGGILNISFGTVKVHATSLFKKLGVSNRTQAALAFTPAAAKAQGPAHVE